MEGDKRTAKNVKETVHPKVQNTFFLLAVVLFINLDNFVVSCLVLEILAVEISAVSHSPPKNTISTADISYNTQYTYSKD